MALRITHPERIAHYHITTRTPGGLYWLGSAHRDMLRDQLERTACFCGVKVLAYAFMINHLHLLVEVPPKASARDLSDAEIVGRVGELYFQDDRAERLHAGLISADPGEKAAAQQERERYRALMCDLSIFMQMYKMRFVRWFNSTHGRFGTIWSERFLSQALPADPVALQRVATYIDLNAVRAGLCDDPMHYRHCSYAEAVAVSGMARDGISALMAVAGRDAENGWDELHAGYRRLMFEMVAVAPDAETEGETALAHGPESKSGISAAKQGAVFASHGKLAEVVVKAHRARYLARGASFGPKPIPEPPLQDNQANGPLARRERRERWSRPETQPSLAPAP